MGCFESCFWIIAPTIGSARTAPSSCNEYPTRRVRARLVDRRAAPRQAYDLGGERPRHGAAGCQIRAREPRQVGRENPRTRRSSQQTPCVQATSRSASIDGKVSAVRRNTRSRRAPAYRVAFTIVRQNPTFISCRRSLDFSARLQAQGRRRGAMNTAFSIKLPHGSIEYGVSSNLP